MNILTKKYRLVYEDNKVIEVGKYEDSKTYTIHNFEESDTKKEIDDKIKELDLILTEEQKEKWDKII